MILHPVFTALREASRDAISEPVLRWQAPRTSARIALRRLLAKARRRQQDQPRG